MTPYEHKELRKTCKGVLPHSRALTGLLENGKLCVSVDLELPSLLPRPRITFF